MRKFTLLIFLSFTTLLFANAADSKLDSVLAQRIKADKRMNVVKNMAEELVRKGLTAGDGYVEIWIRDLNTFVETACAVSDKQRIRESLITFFKFQGEDGNIPDGYTAKIHLRFLIILFIQI